MPVNQGVLFFYGFGGELREVGPERGPFPRGPGDSALCRRTGREFRAELSRAAAQEVVGRASRPRTYWANAGMFCTGTEIVVVLREVDGAHMFPAQG